MVQDILEETKKLVWPEVRKYLKPQKYPAEFRIPKIYQNDIENAYWRVLRDYPERKGKYIRATIIRLVAESLGVEPLLTVKTAAAMQISEDWLLIHDDWEDNSNLRRGKPTLHKIYGDKLAVNAGDALNILMWKIILDNKKLLGIEKTWKIANEFYSMLSRTAIGQAVEIDWIQKNKSNLIDNDWYFVADGKTSYYTIAGPARLGAILGNANEKELSILSKFGLYLGRCFQLVDDILDITSDFSGLKEKANDIYEGKRTLILGHLTRNASVKDKTKLDNILNKDRDKKTKEEVAWVVRKMHEYGSIDYSWKVAQRLKQKSKSIFEKDLKFLSRNPARSDLKELIDFVLERKY